MKCLWYHVLFALLVAHFTSQLTRPVWCMLLRELRLKQCDLSLGLMRHRLKSPKVLITDAMAVLQSMKKTSTTQKLRPARGIRQAHCLHDDRLQWGTSSILPLSGSVTEKQDSSEESCNIHRVSSTFTNEAHHVPQGAFVFVKNQKQRYRHVCWGIVVWWKCILTPNTVFLNLNLRNRTPLMSSISTTVNLLVV